MEHWKEIIKPGVLEKGWWMWAHDVDALHGRHTVRNPLCLAHAPCLSADAQAGRSKQQDAKERES